MYRLRAAHIRFLKAVYVKTYVHRLFSELQKQNSGFWGSVWTGIEGVERSGMMVMREELQRCATTNFENKENGSLEMLDLVFEALIPMLWCPSPPH